MASSRAAPWALAVLLVAALCYSHGVEAVSPPTYPPTAPPTAPVQQQEASTRLSFEAAGLDPTTAEACANLTVLTLDTLGASLLPALARSLSIAVDGLPRSERLLELMPAAVAPCRTLQGVFDRLWDTVEDASILGCFGFEYLDASGQLVLQPTANVGLVEGLRDIARALIDLSITYCNGDIPGDWGRPNGDESLLVEKVASADVLRQPPNPSALPPPPPEVDFDFPVPEVPGGPPPPFNPNEDSDARSNADAKNKRGFAPPPAGPAEPTARPPPPPFNPNEDSVAIDNFNAKNVRGFAPPPAGPSVPTASPPPPPFNPNEDSVAIDNFNAKNVRGFAPPPEGPAEDQSHLRRAILATRSSSPAPAAGAVTGAAGSGRLRGAGGAASAHPLRGDVSRARSVRGLGRRALLQSTPDVHVIMWNSSHDSSGRLMKGRPEVQAGGQTYSLCERSVSPASAHVICRAFRYAGGILHRGGTFGEATSPFLSTGLNCAGSETNIADCPPSAPTSPECTPEEAVGVVCYPAFSEKDYCSDAAVAIARLHPAAPSRTVPTASRCGQLLASAAEVSTVLANAFPGMPLAVEESRQLPCFKDFVAPLLEQWISMWSEEAAAAGCWTLPFSTKRVPASA
ncbi:hypothetical protein HYH03_001995 [Edaphochlamys debaryana]|uniref:SRCR domain-containing protein n=1 Tax=Edaphochlamys debaryana TaxID=47281 RepID=A0A836C4Q7_9CHLO|nr:hypothetical protein HYH03_001995 [Edaphochlamys debaryana]|eukprot:KAG2500426.1 hypothetical protein HYH03_001995 [Edaphochlamys debaryana]